MPEKLHRILLLGLALVLSTAAISGCATGGIGDSLGLSPHWDWKTIETEHFRLTFPVELADAARRSANYLEDAHRVLSPKLKWEPRNRVQVLVIDNEDAANGLTSPTGRFGMVFYATPPDNWFSTYYYDDWLRLLVIHEYTHFLNMDPTTDYADALRTLFGDLFLPNTVWPVWMLEGLAVYMETRLTHAGRGRSPYYEMVLRAAVEKGVLNTQEFMTLDRVNGSSPYYPGGETPYLFGYHMMNRLDDRIIGNLSLRSSGRIPFFINGNLENITGKDWYKYWDEWVLETTQRTQAQLERIRSKPLTELTPVTQGARLTLGSAVSPDGKWLAYHQETNEQSMALWLLDRSAPGNKPVLATEKILGATLAFTPDSKAIAFSSLRRHSAYQVYSELGIYDIASGRTTWLTDGLRARDPDISPDGKWVTFTVAENTAVHLAVAPLEQIDGAYRLGAHRILFTSQPLDLVSTPKFSRDGARIYFSHHPNGRVGEDLASVEVANGKFQKLVADGNFNRFPTVHPNGDVYFISDATGVENIHCWNGKRSAPVTNVSTGLSFPTFDAAGRLYADSFSYTGWDLAEVKGVTPAVAVDAPKISKAPAPVLDADSDSHAENKTFDLKDYSVFPSIWPRQWLPWLVLKSTGIVAGGEILGFDAVDRHHYIGFIDYDTQIKRPDLFVLYGNRSLGPTLTGSIEDRTTYSYTNPLSGQLAYFDRKTRYQASITYPIRWTRSTLTPGLFVNREQTTYYGVDADGSDFVQSTSRGIPSLDVGASYFDGESSALAISTESGRSAALAFRRYFLLENPVYKVFFKETEYLHLGKHTVLAPSIKGSYVTESSNYGPAYVNTEGRSLGTLGPGFSGDSLDQLSLRGYPNVLFFSRSVGILALDYRFPLFRIYRGLGTNPAFLDYLYGVAFSEAAYFPTSSLTAISAGAGLRLTGDVLLHIPTVLALEYHQGFNESVGGTGELFFSLGLSGITF